MLHLTGIIGSQNESSRINRTANGWIDSLPRIRTFCARVGMCKKEPTDMPSGAPKDLY